MKPVKTHTFAGGKYYIDWLDSPMLGMCELPSKKDKLYLVVPEGKGKKDLSVNIHECMHAEHFSEEHVDRQDKNWKDAGDRMADFLWRSGWRNI